MHRRRSGGVLRGAAGRRAGHAAAAPGAFGSYPRLGASQRSTSATVIPFRARVVLDLVAADAGRR